MPSSSSALRIRGRSLAAAVKISSALSECGLEGPRIEMLTDDGNRAHDRFEARTTITLFCARSRYKEPRGGARAQSRISRYLFALERPTCEKTMAKAWPPSTPTTKSLQTRQTRLLRFSALELTEFGSARRCRAAALRRVPGYERLRTPERLPRAENRSFLAAGCRDLKGRQLPSNDYTAAIVPAQYSAPTPPQTLRSPIAATEPSAAQGPSSLICPHGPLRGGFVLYNGEGCR